MKYISIIFIIFTPFSMAFGQDFSLKFEEVSKSNGEYIVDIKMAMASASTLGSSNFIITSTNLENPILVTNHLNNTDYDVSVKSINDTKSSFNMGNQNFDFRHKDLKNIIYITILYMFIYQLMIIVDAVILYQWQI